MADDHGRKNRMEGTWDKIKGEAKDTFGDMVDNEKMQAEGKWDKVKGEAKQSYGEMKERFSDLEDREEHRP